MMRLLYPLIGSALITIVPFLMTFEKGQDIVRGIFGYSEFALLLLFAWVKSWIGASTASGLTRRNVVTIATLVVIIVAMLVVAFMDLGNLLAMKGWDMGWRAVVPFATCGLAVAMMWKVPPFKFTTINLILFVSLATHLAALNYYAAQPLAQFPVIEYLDRMAPVPVERKFLPDEFLAKYNVVDSASVTHNFVDSTRSNVIVLVESWGIPLDNDAFEKELQIFRDAGFAETVRDSVLTAGTMKVGVHSRMYSRTRTAEREDLIYTLTRDSVSRRKDTTFLPYAYRSLGYKTAFLFGGDSLEQYRYKYIRNVGFDDLLWGNKSLGSREFYAADSVMVAKMDSLLAETTADSVAMKNRSVAKRFVAFTTSDSRFPLPGFKDPYSGSADSIQSVYYTQLYKTLKAIAELARKYPEVRFVVQGDHEPILSPLAFQERFYKRWIPFVVLN